MRRIEFSNPHVNSVDMIASRMGMDGEKTAVLREQIRLSPGQRGAMDVADDEYVQLTFARE